MHRIFMRVFDLEFQIERGVFWGTDPANLPPQNVAAGHTLPATYASSDGRNISSREFTERPNRISRYPHTADRNLRNFRKSVQTHPE